MEDLQKLNVNLSEVMSDDFEKRYQEKQNSQQDSGNKYSYIPRGSSSNQTKQNFKIRNINNQPNSTPNQNSLSTNNSTNRIPAYGRLNIEDYLKEDDFLIQESVKQKCDNVLFGIEENDDGDDNDFVKIQKLDKEYLLQEKN